MRLGYAIVYVPDVAESIRFFERAFGLKRKFLHDSGTYGELDTGETTLSSAAHALGGDALSRRLRSGQRIGAAFGDGDCAGHGRCGFGTSARRRVRCDRVGSAGTQAVGSGRFVRACAGWDAGGVVYASRGLSGSGALLTLAEASEASGANACRAHSFDPRLTRPFLTVGAYGRFSLH